MATDTVANATKIVRLATKTSPAVAKLATSFNPFEPEPAGRKLANFPEPAVTGRSDRPRHFVLSRPRKGKMFLSFVLTW